MPGGTSGFVQLRRGLSEHVRDGRLSFFEAALYVFILMDTNPATGLCYGSAGLFSAIYSVPSRTCRDALEKLEEKGYLKRFPTRGRHGSYPILVNKFRCSDGAMKGKYVNSSKSVSWKNIVYESSDDYVDDNVNDGAVAGVNEDVNESAGRVDTRDKRLDTGDKNSSSKSKPSTDNEQDEKIYEAYPRKVGKEAALKAIRKAVERLVKGDKTHPPRDAYSARRFLWKKAAQYSASPAGQKSLDKNHEFRPHPSTWFNQGRYFDDPSEWVKPNGATNANIPPSKAHSDLAVLAESLGYAEYQSASHQNGNLPTGEDRQSDARTIHGDFDAVGPTRLPSGDGDAFGESEGAGRDLAPFTW
jgi:hypothetical protein